MSIFRTKIELLLKRLIDILVALIVLVVFCPILLFFAILLKVFQGQAFFFQKRPGQQEKIFCIIKFQTMTNQRNKEGNLLPDDQRITPIGKFLRSTSIDEIPQLLNVLLGDMSLVGPRPLLCEYLSLYSDKQKKRHLVKPGITGWAQVNGRNAISWEEKFDLDVWYVEHWSFWLDLKILLLTLGKVIRREGINSQSNAAVEAFKGTSDIQ